MGYFDDSYYIASKLKQLTAENATDANGEPYNVYTLRAAIASAGLTPEEHYKAYGQGEKLSPNAYFNETEYLEAKLAQLESVGETAPGGQPYTLETLKAVIAGSGLSAAEHYELYGSKETTADGHLLNPSNAFDANAYVAAKLAQLQSEGSPEAAQWAGKTVAELVAVLQEAGISPVAHYLDYGAAEASSAKIPLVQTVPSEQRVANDPAREANHEVVPTNYNPATPAPGDAKPAPVTKPADVAQKVDASVSPAPIIPEKSAPVPGDDAYVAPPANIKDTVANPVIPPSSTDAGTASGNWMVVNPDKGTGTIVGQDGTIKGEVKVEITPGTGTGGSTVVIPPAEDKPVDKLPPATTLPPSVTPDPDKPGNVTPPSTGGGDGGSTGGTPAPTPDSVTVTQGTDTNADVWTIAGKGAVTLAMDSDKWVFSLANGTKAEIASGEAVKTLKIADTISLTSTYAILNSPTGPTKVDGKVTVSDALDQTKANALDTAVTGIVTATIADTTSVSDLKGLTATGGANAYSITVNEASVSAADLTTIRTKTTVNVALADTVTTITGTTAEVKKLYVTDKADFTGLGGEAVTVSDSGSDVSAKDLNDINTANGDGTVTVTNAVNFTGTENDLTTALTGDAKISFVASSKLIVSGAITAGKLDTLIDAASGDTTVQGHTSYDFTDLDEGKGLTIIGTDGVDSITGSKGNDTITGGSGGDTINGGSGDDTINGGSGDDTITGGDGDDTITGGAGNDTLTGGAGTNTFKFAAADVTGVTPSSTNLDTITDWSTGTSNKITFGSALAIAKAVTGDTTMASINNATGLATFTGEAATAGALDKKLAAISAALGSGGATPSANDTVVFVDGSDSYVFISNNTVVIDEGDILIKLTGVTATGITLDSDTSIITGFTS